MDIGALEKAVALFLAAPAAVILVLAAVTYVVWHFRGQLSDAETRGLRERAAALEQRLYLEKERSVLRKRPRKRSK